jgi:hypothetical protein
MIHPQVGVVGRVRQVYVHSLLPRACSMLCNHSVETELWYGAAHAHRDGAKPTVSALRRDARRSRARLEHAVCN